MEQRYISRRGGNGIEEAVYKQDGRGRNGVKRCVQTGWGGMGWRGGVKAGWEGWKREE